METPEQLIAWHIVRSRYEDLPENIVALVKEKILDTIGVMIAGSSAAGCNLVEQQLLDWGGKPEGTVLVTGARIPAPHAAQIHGTWAHAHEFCDSDDRHGMKGSAGCLPVALALAELSGGSGKDLILAMALGLDIGCRVGLALPTGTVVGRDADSFSGVTAGAKLLGLSEENVLNALSIAYTNLARAKMGMGAPSLTKRLVPGQITRGSTWAAMMAKRGYPADREVLHGENSYYKLVRRVQADESQLTRALGKEFQVIHCPKPYPSGRFVHQPIDAALKVKAMSGFALNDIAGVVVGLAKKGVVAIGAAGGDGGTLEDKQRPKGIIDAQTSAPYNVAVALRKGSVTLADFTDAAMRDPETLALTARITEEHRPELDDFPDFITPALVEVTLKNGRKLAARVDYAKGHPSNPCTREEMRAKFRSCIGFSAKPLAAEKVSQAAEMIDNLDRVKDVKELTALLVA